jgi:hypothetical protein
LNTSQHKNSQFRDLRLVEGQPGGAAIYLDALRNIARYRQAVPVQAGQKKKLIITGTA